jgi:hypothetical protein
MKMKFKKLWILYDGEEKIEELEGEYDSCNIGKISLDMLYVQKIGLTEGSYIMMPLKADDAVFRLTLIKYLIKKEQSVIDKANNKIQKLVNKL